MAKTTKPVSLLIHPSLDGLEMDKLREQGHTVHRMIDLAPGATDDDCALLSSLSYDRILGPNCWWLPKEHIDLLPTALKAAQEERYKDQPKPTKRKKKPTEAP